MKRARASKKIHECDRFCNCRNENKMKLYCSSTFCQRLVFGNSLNRACYKCIQEKKIVKYLKISVSTCISNFVDFYNALAKKNPKELSYMKLDRDTFHPIINKAKDKKEQEFLINHLLYV